MRLKDDSLDSPPSTSTAGRRRPTSEQQLELFVEEAVRERAILLKARVDDATQSLQGELQQVQTELSARIAELRGDFKVLAAGVQELGRRVDGFRDVSIGPVGVPSKVGGDTDLTSEEPGKEEIAAQSFGADALRDELRAEIRHCAFELGNLRGALARYADDCCCELEALWRALRAGTQPQHAAKTQFAAAQDNSSGAPQRPSPSSPSPPPPPPPPANVAYQQAGYPASAVPSRKDVLISSHWPGGPPLGFEHSAVEGAAHPRSRDFADRCTDIGARAL